MICHQLRLDMFNQVTYSNMFAWSRENLSIGEDQNKLEMNCVVVLLPVFIQIPLQMSHYIQGVPKKLHLVLEGCSTPKFWARNKSRGCFGILGQKSKVE